MASTADETRKIYDLVGVTPSEQIQLVLPLPPKKDDSAVATNSTPLAQPSIAQMLQSKQDTAALDDLFSPAPAKRTPALASSGLNMPNAQALAGGGSGPRGSSTSNGGGGGSGNGSGGAGPGFSNSNQFFNNYLGLVGSALAPAATPGTNTPIVAATPQAVSLSSNAAPLSPVAMPQATTTPAALRHWTPPAATHIAPTVPGLAAGDPLYVLDTNTGETVPANATLNTFSTWTENLSAQVSGASVTSYSWDTSQAPDLSNISGQSTANLQGTWASFTGAARINTITLTETSSAGQLSQTMTFLVAGTDSPAYSSTRPTSSSTWAGVITPDQISSGQATAPGGPYASLGLADGSVQTAFAMPSYNPNVAPLSLVYNSTTANAQPIFLVHYQLPIGQTVPATITAQLTLNGTAGATITYSTSGLNPGDWVQIALQGDATALSTGRYPWQIVVTNGSTPTNYSGDVGIVNQANSPFGAGWSLGNVEQLVAVSGGVMLVNPDGTSLFFAGSGGSFTSPAGDFSTLVQNLDGSYTRTLTDGTQINFSSAGLQTSIVNRDGNTTTFGYTAGLLTSITDMNGQTTTLAYNTSGQLSTITDPATRTATLGYTGNQLTSITDPANDVWQYAYDSANDLTTLTDPNSEATTLRYNFAGRFTFLSQADGTTWILTAEQMNGLATPGTGTASNPASAVLLAVGDQAQFSDGNFNVWTTGLDWLGFGLDTLDADPLGDTSLIYRDSNGLAWLSADQLGRATRDFFDSKGNTTEEVAPDDSTQQYSYNQFGEVTQYTDQENDVTSYSYNSKGDLTQMTDALGDITTYAYNTAGLLTSTTDPNDNTTTYGYDTLNRLIQTTNAIGGITSYAYDAASNVTSTTDARDFTSTFAYDPMGRMTGQTLPDTPGVFSTYTYGYDKVGNQTSVTDPLNHTTTYDYNWVNELFYVQDPLGHLTRYGYDNAGNLTMLTDPMGQVTTYAYDAANRLVSATNPMSDQTTYGYDAANEQTSVTDPMGNVTAYSYTSRGEVASESLYAFVPGGSGAGTQALVGGNALPDDPNNLVLFEQIDNTFLPCGCPGSTTEVDVDAPIGNTAISGAFSADLEHLPGGSITFSGSLNGSISGSTVSGTLQGVYNYYNEEGQYIGSQPASGSFEGTISGSTFSGIWSFGVWSGGLNGTLSDNTLSGTLSYDNGGGSKIEGNFSAAPGNTTIYQRDPLHRVTSVTDANGNTTTYAYDKDSNQTSVTDPLSNTTTFAYNALNRLASVTLAPAVSAPSALTPLTDPSGETTTYGYDQVGNQTSVTDPLGHVTSYTYDGLDRVLTATNPNGGLTSYVYDLAGNQTSLTDPDNNTTSYAYDAANRLTTTTDPLDHQTTYAYNADDLLTSTTDADGRTIDYGYDDAQRLTSETWVGGNYTATYAYNANSQLTSAQDPFSSYTYTYDALGNVTSVDNSGTPGMPTVTLDYGYDSFDNRTSLTDSLGGSISYAYDANNQLTSLGLSVSSTLDARLTFGYDTASRLTGITRTAAAGSDTITSSFSYDNVNRLTNITHTDPTKALTLANYTYGYDAASRLTSYEDANSSLTYGYDPAGQLTSATGTLDGSSYSVSYSYDANGNRTMPGYSTGTGNQLTSDGTYSYTYDNDGNTLTQTDIATGSVTYYTWDYRNRLTEVQIKDSGGTLLQDEQFTYDVHNNRIGVALNGTQQSWTVYDGSNPYMDFNGGGQLTQRYLTNPLGLSQFYGQVNASGVTQWFLTDNLNSIRQVVSTSGSPLDTITYDPFGGLVTQTNALNAPRFLYAGGAVDSLTGNYQFGRRYYGPVDGRWLSQDPEGFGAGDPNLYRYVFNQPTDATDPTGLDSMFGPGTMPGIPPWLHRNPMYPRSPFPQTTGGDWALSQMCGVGGITRYPPWQGTKQPQQTRMCHCWIKWADGSENYIGYMTHESCMLIGQRLIGWGRTWCSSGPTTPFPRPAR